MTSALLFPRTTLCASHGERCQRVLEGLFEGKELQNRKIHRPVETQSAFIWADNIVVLDTVAHVGLHVAFVVYPCDTELNESVGNAKTLDKIALLDTPLQW